jgi:hypothetical protein
MVIDQLGIVLINPFDLDNGQGKFLVSGADANGISAFFYHPNRTQGIGITFDGLRALGSNANQNIVMRPRGTGTFQVEGAMSTNSNINISGTLGAAGGLLDFNPFNQFDRYGQIRFGCAFWQAFSYANIRFDATGSVNDTTTYIRHSTNGYSRFDTYIISGGQQFPSDIRIKKNIQDLNDDTALQQLLRIEPKSYDYIDIDKGATNVYGFIAQQVKEIIPNAIKIVCDV